MISLEINGYSVIVRIGSTVRQAADALGIELPRFCYHERLRVAGNCRICLVEVIGSPKPVASCAMPATNGMRVFTDSPMVMKARESVIELLRINHPLDCPICDQGGECDLQDQAMRYGSDRTRMYRNKRGVEDKYLGPLVKMVMTRCIHCTRCIRFASEVAGIGILGTSGRGTNTEVGTYVDSYIVSGLSGNRVDRCPVGALTSKPLAFKVRSWELDAIDTYDDSDGRLSSVRVQVIGNTIYRMLPRTNDDTNGQWLGDKGRYSIDAYNHARCMNVIVYDNTRNNYRNIDSIVDGLSYVGKVLDKLTSAIIIMSASIDQAILSVISDVYLKLPSSMGFVNIGYSNKIIINGYKSEYTSMTSITNMGLLDIVILIGTNVRDESPVVDAYIRNYYMNGSNIVTIGIHTSTSYSYPVSMISLIDVIDMYNGTYIISNSMITINNIGNVVGTSVMSRDTGYIMMCVIRDIAHCMADDMTNITHATLHTRSNVVGAIMIGLPGYDSCIDHAIFSTYINIGVMGNELVENGVYNIYTSSLGRFNIDDNSIIFSPWVDYLSSIHSIIVPIVTNHEQSSLMINTDGMFNIMKKVIIGSLSVDNGSVNGLMVSSLLHDGSVDTDISYSGIYGKRINSIEYIYEGIDNDCDSSYVPSVHNYYTDGYGAASISSSISECSEAYVKRSNYIEIVC
jgi:NADH-quinone oxidoreductase chain G